MKKYQEAYDKLNIKFDVYTGESSVSKESMDEALAQLDDMGFISNRQGAKAIDLNEWGLREPIDRKACHVQLLRY